MKRDLAKKERKRLAKAFPDLTLNTSKNPVMVTGIMWLDPETGYSVNLIVPVNYPEDVPVLFCDKREIPWEVDRHVFCYPQGMACLCVSSEYRKRWPHGSDLVDFLEKLVKPFFVGQVYYDAHNKWPPGWERSHDRGVIEAYEELLTPEIESPSIDTIEKFILIMCRRGHPGHKEKCPCGSGKYIQQCHRKLIVRLRNNIDPAHARMDYAMQFSKPENKSAGQQTDYP